MTPVAKKSPPQVQLYFLDVGEARAWILFCFTLLCGLNPYLLERSDTQLDIWVLVKNNYASNGGILTSIELEKDLFKLRVPPSEALQPCPYECRYNTCNIPYKGSWISCNLIFILVFNAQSFRL